MQMKLSRQVPGKVATGVTADLVNAQPSSSNVLPNLASVWQPLSSGLLFAWPTTDHISLYYIAHHYSAN